jgi:hypothetical protein
LGDAEGAPQRVKSAVEFARQVGRVKMTEDAAKAWEAAYPELSGGDQEFSTMSDEERQARICCDPCVSRSDSAKSALPISLRRQIHRLSAQQ